MLVKVQLIQCMGRGDNHMIEVYIIEKYNIEIIFENGSVQIDELNLNYNRNVTEKELNDDIIEQCYSIYLREKGIKNEKKNLYNIQCYKEKEAWELYKDIEEIFGFGIVGFVPPKEYLLQVIEKSERILSLFPLFPCINSLYGYIINAYYKIGNYEECIKLIQERCTNNSFKSYNFNRFIVEYKNIAEDERILKLLRERKLYGSYSSPDIVLDTFKRKHNI